MFGNLCGHRVHWKSLFGGGKAPKPAPTRVAPVADDREIKRARERELARKYGSRGRTSTVLDAKDRLG